MQNERVSPADVAAACRIESVDSQYNERSFVAGATMMQDVIVGALRGAEFGGPAEPVPHAPGTPAKLTDVEIRIRCMEAASRSIQTMPIVGQGETHPTKVAASNALGLAQAYYDFVKANLLPFSMTPAPAKDA